MSTEDAVLDQTDAEAEGDGELKRTLTFFDGFCMNVGIIVGSGIFASPGTVVEALGSPQLSLFAWAFGGVLAILGSLCYAELGTAMPEAGGEVVYLARSWGKWASFAYSWGSIVVGRSASVAIISLVFAQYLASITFLDDASDDLEGDWRVKLIAVIAIVALTGVNSQGAREGATVQNIATVLKFMTVVFVICLMFAYWMKDDAVDNFSAGKKEKNEGGMGDFSVALISVMWAFDGWNSLNFMMSELIDPSQLPTICIAGVSCVTVIYISINFAYLSVLSTDAVATASTIGTDYAEAAAGAGAKWVMAAAIALSALGSANGTIMGGGRVIYAAAVDGYVPARLAKVHPETGTPRLALVVQCVWSCVLTCSGSVGDLINLFGVAAWLFYGMAGAAVIILRRKEPEMERPYKVIGYPVTPGLLVAVAAYLVIDSVRNEPVSSIAAIVLSVAPMGLYFLIFKKELEEQPAAITELGDFSGLHDDESDEEDLQNNDLQKVDESTCGIVQDEEGSALHANM